MVRRREARFEFEALEGRLMLSAGVTLFSNVNRFLDGTVTPGGPITPAIVMIDSFENMSSTTANWTFAGVTTAQSALYSTNGTHSLQMTFSGGSGSNAAYIKGGTGWGDTASDGASAWASEVLWNNTLDMDIYNPQSHVVNFSFYAGKDIWTTPNLGKIYTYVLQPGANHISISCQDMINYVYRGDRVMQNSLMWVADSGTTVLYLDNVHWTGPGMGQDLIQYGKMFDAGTDANWSTPMPTDYNRPYFNQLGATTPYTAAKGWGWQTPSTYEFTYTQGVMQSSNSSGRQPHDPVLRNYISDISSPLLVDLPNGAYRIQWVEGNIFMSDGTNNPLDYDLSVLANGQTIPIRSGATTNIADRAKWFYGNDQTDYMPGMDYFSAYMGNRFKPYECDVNVTGGQLSLQFLTNPVNRANLDFLIIYPVNKADVIEPELATFWHDLAFRYNNQEYKAANLTVETARALPGVHDEFLNPSAAATREAALKASPQNPDGLITFNRDTADDVYADTVPNVSDITSAVSAAGPQGTITSMALNLHATNAMQNIQVSLGTLTGPGGATIAPANVSLKFVQYIERMSGQNVHGDWTYMVMPWYLVDRTSTNLAADMSERYWLNVNVPSNAAPGTYTTTATISADGIAPHQVQLSLTVQPFVLDAVPSNIEYSTIWSMGQEWTTMPDADYLSASRNMSSATQQTFSDMLTTALYGRVQSEFTLMKNYGLNLVYDSGHNELNKAGTIALPSYITNIITKTPIANSSSRHFATTVQMGTQQYITKANVQSVKSTYGSCIMSCDPKDWSNDQENAGIYRFMGGFMMWAYGGTGVNFDQWNNNWADPYNPFDGHSGEWGSLATPASTNWPTINSSVELEGIREGIKDYRYLVTLQNLIAAHPGTPAATNATTYLNTLSASINGSASYYWGLATDTYGGWDSTYTTKSTDWTAANYSAARSQIATLITAFSGNSAPTASVGGPYVVEQNYPVTLNASASSDPDSDPLTYAWDVNGDGNYTDATGVRPTLTAAQLQTLGIAPGVSNNLRVQVNDGQGHVVTSSAGKLTMLWAGDADADGKVTFQDYITLELNFGTSTTGWSVADFNNDGRVNFQDYIVLETNFNKVVALSAPAPLMAPLAAALSTVVGPVAPAAAPSSQASLDVVRPRAARFGHGLSPSRIGVISTAKMGWDIDLIKDTL